MTEKIRRKAGMPPASTGLPGLLKGKSLSNDDGLQGRRFFSVVLFVVFLTAASSGRHLVPGRVSLPILISPSPLVAPAAALPAVSAGIQEIVETFSRNQTITAALMQHGLSRETIMDFVQATRPVFNLSKVKAGQEFKLVLGPDGNFQQFNYKVDDERYLTVYRKDDRFIPEMKRFHFETRVEPVAGVIDESLFTAVTAAGEQESLAGDLAALFDCDIDFNTEIQKGDSFRMLVEKRYLNGQFYSYGAKPILAADLIAQKKMLSGFRFEDENGKSAYFDPAGKSLKKSFLKSPLPFLRIVGRFTRSRFHPILKIFRPHSGIDYAAPTGTMVRAVAAGTVEFAGWNTEGGKTVKLRHAGGYETSYMHLSRILVRYGARVSQGTLIGQVGATGLATGPHLDFRLLFHGKFINPATKVAIPPSPPVARASMERFASMRDELRNRLDQITLADK